MFQNRQHNSILDLDFKRSIGQISIAEYKRRTIINEIRNMALINEKASLPWFHTNPYLVGFQNNEQNDILAMEIDPKEGRCLLGISRYNFVAIYNVSKDNNNENDTFNQIAEMKIPRDTNRKGTPNAVHWLWDCKVFTVSTKECVHFYDSSLCKIIETVKLRTHVMNHIIAAQKYSTNKYVGVTGGDGDIYMIDMRHGIVVMTMKSIEDKPIRAIHWHPTFEYHFITGNDNGNLFLWDLRYQKKDVLQFNNDNSFSKSKSHNHPIIGSRFYNNGNNIISVVSTGEIKTWEVVTGIKCPTYFEPLSLSRLNIHSWFKEYQFAITEYLKEDIGFFPSAKGLTMIDFDKGEYLSNTNDTNIPINCATYDSKHYNVYAGSHDIVKMWSSKK